MTHARPRTIRAAARAASFAALFLAPLFALTPPATAQQTTDAAPAGVGTSPPATKREMTLAVTVTDIRGRYVGGLEKGQFTILDGGSPRDITSFSSVGEPASVGVLFDISGSMEPAWLDAMRYALARFLSNSPAAGEYFLWAFNNKIYELTDWTHEAKTLADGLNKIAPRQSPKKLPYGSTAIYDASAAALEKLNHASNRKRVLLIFTDGGPDDASRQADFKELKRMVRNSGVLVYSVAMIERGSPASLAVAGQEELDELAANSGARAFFPETVAEMNEIVERIAIELRNQYMIGFMPADAAKKGELNKLRVKVKPPPEIKNTLYVRHREGYFTPE